MSIQSISRVAGPYYGNDVATLYPFGFKVFSASEIRVIQTGTDGIDRDLVLGTEFAVTLDADQDATPGGSVSLAAPLKSGVQIVITSSLALLQPLTLTNQGGFYPKALESSLDRLTILLQQLAEEVSRSVRLPLSSIGDPADLLDAINTSVAEANSAVVDASAAAAEAQAAAGIAIGNASAVPVLAGGATTALPLASRFRRMVSPRDYGAKGDAVQGTASMTAGSAIVTVAGISLSASDVGKAATVLGAGASGARINGTIISVASASQMVLSVAASTTVSAAGISIGTDDTAAWNAWAAAINPPTWDPNALATRKGYIDAGRYKITGTIAMNAGTFYAADIDTDGAQSTFIDAWAVSGVALSYIGGAGRIGNVFVGPMTIDMGSPTSTNCAIMVHNFGWITFVGIFFENCGTACLLKNTAVGFTEGVVHDGCYFGFNCRTWLEYRVEGGTPSFRSSGLRNCKGNMPATGGPVIVVGPGAMPYMAPLDVTVWHGGTLIADNSGQAAGLVLFVGTVTVESPSILLASGGGPVLVGSIVGSGPVPAFNLSSGIRLGTLRLASDAIQYTNGAVGVTLKPMRYWVGPTTYTGQPLVLPVQGVGDSAERVMVSLTVGYTGYLYEVSIIFAKVSGANQYYGTVVSSFVYDGVAAGTPSISYSNSSIVITNSKYPVGIGVTYNVVAMGSAIRVN